MSNEAKEQQAERQSVEERGRRGEYVRERERQRAQLFHITAITVRKNQNGADVRP